MDNVNVHYRGHPRCDASSALANSYNLAGVARTFNEALFYANKVDVVIIFS
jgi:hypothetical protein